MLFLWPSHFFSAEPAGCWWWVMTENSQKRSPSCQHMIPYQQKVEWQPCWINTLLQQWDENEQSQKNKKVNMSKHMSQTLGWLMKAHSSKHDEQNKSDAPQKTPELDFTGDSDFKNLLYDTHHLIPTTQLWNGAIYKSHRIRKSEQLRFRGRKGSKRRQVIWKNVWWVYFTWWRSVRVIPTKEEKKQQSESLQSSVRFGLCSERDNLWTIKIIVFRFMCATCRAWGGRSMYSLVVSRVAWQSRAGLITHRLMDRNHPLL